MQQRGPAQGARVGQRLGALRRVEHELNRAVLDRVHDVWTSFRHFIDFLRRDASAREKARRSARPEGLETKLLQKAQGLDDALLIRVAHGDEDDAALERARASPELALGEGCGKAENRGR